MVVVDASVAVKWVLDEPGSEAAAALRDQPLLAPSLLLAECANALWVRQRRGELTAEEVTARLAGLLVAPVVLVPLEELVEPGIELAIELGLTVYDSLYLALALRGGHSLVTADRRIVEAAERAGLQATVRLLG